MSPFGDALELSEGPPGVGVGAPTSCALTAKLAMKTSIIAATKTNLWRAIFAYLKEIKVAVQNICLSQVLIQAIYRKMHALYYLLN